MTDRIKRIAVTGARGQLGTAIVERLEQSRHEVLPFGRRELDLADHRRARAILADASPSVIVNCAAYTDVDGAESNAAAALEANAFAVNVLARTAQALDAVLIQFSTDFVFDGRATVPYTETDAANPRNTYALSKLIGEWFAAEVERHYVLRVESLFGGPAVLNSPRRSSIDRIADALTQGRECRAFTDRIVSPSYVVDLAEATLTLLDRRPPSGVYHCVNSGHCTWYELALEMKRLVRSEAPVSPTSLRDANLVAERPAFAALSNLKLAAAGIPMPTWQDALERYLAVRNALA